MTTPEIWYLSFEQHTDHGAGLGSYIRQVIASAEATGRAVRIFQPSRDGTGEQRHSDGCVTIINVPMIETPARDALGHWMCMSLSMAEAVGNELKHKSAPAAIEVPDGFALGYFLFQRKLTGEAALVNIPLILCAHTPIGLIEDWIGNDTHRLPNWWIYRAEKWCYLAADAVVTLSDAIERILNDRGYLSSSSLVHRAVNPYLPISQPISAPAIQRTSVVGMASRMVDWKGLRQTMEAAAAAEAANIPIVFELCGHTHSDFERAKTDYAKLFASGRVKYLGVLNASELDERRKLWTCQLHPAPLDNFPYAVVEALFRGLPCLISQGNGVGAVLPNTLKEKLIVDFSDPVEVCRKIEKSASIRADIANLDLSLFGPDAYFSNRDALIARLSVARKRNLFPFVDADQAQTNLRLKVGNNNEEGEVRLTVVIPYYRFSTAKSPPSLFL
jgi:glycosyltransferase involved in cell wall biosynthesis